MMDARKLYWHLLENPPLLPGGERKRGSTPHDEFWRGYDNYRAMSARTSLGAAAWRAGRAYAKRQQREQDRLERQVEADYLGEAAAERYADQALARGQGRELDALLLTPDRRKA